MLILVAAIVSFFTGAAIVGFITFRIWGQVGQLRRREEEIDEKGTALKRSHAALEEERESFRSRVIDYDELLGENRVLKADINNIDVMLRKLEIDRANQATSHAALAEQCQSLGERYLRDVEKWVGASISANNYAACKQRLQRAIEWCRGIGVHVDAEREAQLLDDLKADFEKAVRAAIEREEQARLKQQIREEQAREREIKKELDRLERERSTLQAALEAALAEAEDAHGAEIESLRARLAEAEEKSRRAVSQAQLTRAGHIYVISNIGSFGDDVVKIGMTRRLAPLDRVKELGDASVPFPFDVHMMISCDDAPTLERALHKHFNHHRVNRVNPRKEFFRVELDAVKSFVEEHHGEVNYVADAEALEYRQSVDMTDDDQEFVEGVFDRTERELGVEDLSE